MGRRVGWRCGGGGGDKSSCMQNKGAGGWLLVVEQNLVNGRFPFTRLRLHSFCPALELTSEYLHRNQKVNHTEPGSGRECTTLRSVATVQKKVKDFSFPALPSYTIYFGCPAKRSPCLLRRVPEQAPICVIRSKRRSGRGAELSKRERLGRAPRQGFTGTRGIPRGRASAARAAAVAAAAPRARWRGGGEPGALRGRPKANVVSAVGSALTRRSGWTERGSARGFGASQASAAASRPVISLVPSRLGRKTARLSLPGLRRADKGLRGKAPRPCHGGPALLMFNREQGSAVPLLPDPTPEPGRGGGMRTPARRCRPGCAEAGPAQPASLSCPAGLFSPWKLR